MKKKNGHIRDRTGHLPQLCMQSGCDNQLHHMPIYVHNKKEFLNCLDVSLRLLTHLPYLCGWQRVRDININFVNRRISDQDSE